jgi:hypothetical protein
MPHNKSETIHEQQRRAEFAEEPIPVKPTRAKNKPASLNRIPKNES